MTTRWYFPGVVLVSVTLLNELLPVVFGTGYNARWDWSFLYVTLKFIALSIFAVVALCVAIYRSVRRLDAPLRAHVVTAALALGYLAALYFFPAPWLID
jgi:hypothetical protein